MVKADTALEGEFAFSIIFRDDQEKRHILTGRSEVQVADWVTALRRASYEFWRTQLVLLQERLSIKTGKDPLLMYPRNQGTVRDEAWRDAPTLAPHTYPSFRSHVGSLQQSLTSKNKLTKDDDLIDFS